MCGGTRRNSLGRQQLKKYDGKTKDVPAEWVRDGELVAGSTVVVNVGGGRNWTGAVTGFFNEKKPYGFGHGITTTTIYLLVAQSYGSLTSKHHSRSGYPYPQHPGSVIMQH